MPHHTETGSSGCKDLKKAVISTASSTGGSTPKLLPNATDAVSGPESMVSTAENSDYLRNTRVMVFAGQYATLRDEPNGTYKSISLAEIVSLANEPSRAEKTQALATIGSSYCKHDARIHKVQEEQGQYSLLRFDIDSGNHSIDTVCSAVSTYVEDALFLVYSTSSATATNRRWRVLVMLSSPVPHEMRRAMETSLRQSIAVLWDITFDTALDRSGQHIFLPAVAPGKRDQDGRPFYYESRFRGRYPLDPEVSMLGEIARRWINDEKSRIQQKEQESEDERKRKRLEREQRRSMSSRQSPIEWFNTHHSIEDVLTEAGYEQSPKNARDWRSPYQTSESYATRVNGDHFVSLSASDGEAGVGVATRNGYLCGDAFSIFVHYMHAGNQESALNDVRGRMASKPSGRYCQVALQ